MTRTIEPTTISLAPLKWLSVAEAVNAAINRMLTSPDVAERLTKLGMDPATGSPEMFAKVLADDYAKWGRS